MRSTANPQQSVTTSNNTLSPELYSSQKKVIELEAIMHFQQQQIKRSDNESAHLRKIIGDLEAEVQRLSLQQSHSDQHYQHLLQAHNNQAETQKQILISNYQHEIAELNIKNGQPQSVPNAVMGSYDDIIFLQAELTSAQARLTNLHIAVEETKEHMKGVSIPAAVEREKYIKKLEEQLASTTAALASQQKVMVISPGKENEYLFQPKVRGDGTTIKKRLFGVFDSAKKTTRSSDSMSKLLLAAMSEDDVDADKSLSKKTKR